MSIHFYFFFAHVHAQCSPKSSRVFLSRSLLSSAPRVKLFIILKKLVFGTTMSSKKEKLLGTKRKQCDKSMEHPRRPHRYRPGTKALRQVRPQTILEVCSDESIEETKEVSVGRKEDAHAPQKPPVPAVSVKRRLGKRGGGNILYLPNNSNLFSA